MNRKLIVTLLRKDIQELDMITEGFMEMNEYPTAIIQLAKRKSEDIEDYIKQLSELKPENRPVESTVNIPEITEPVEHEITVANVIIEKKIEITESINDTPASDKLELDEIKETAEIDIEITNSNPNFIIASDKLPSTSITRNELLSKADNTISSSIANKKISDIKQAINIGDRFRFQRELFSGNGEEMNKTMNYLNQLATFEEVVSFLQSKYGWSQDNETAEDFYQIARRLFL